MTSIEKYIQYGFNCMLTDTDINNISNSISKSDTLIQTAYRGVNIESFDYSIGDTYSFEESFASFTLQESIANEFADGIGISVIFTINNSTGLDISDINSDEQEILISTINSFIIADIKLIDNTYYVTLVSKNNKEVEDMKETVDYKIFTAEELVQRARVFIALMINQQTADSTEIKIDNGRMTNTYGYCNISDLNNIYLKFSSMMLDGRYTLQSVDSVLKHEVGHLLDALERGYSNHDKHFHAIADKYNFHGTSGIVLNKSEIYNTIVPETNQQPRQLKYKVVCNCCGQTVGNYCKKSKAIKSIENNEHDYICKYCKSCDLKLITL